MHDEAVSHAEHLIAQGLPRIRAIQHAARRFAILETEIEDRLTPAPLIGTLERSTTQEVS